MSAIGIIFAVGDTRDDTKLLRVTLSELSGQPLGWSRKNRIVVVIFLGVLISPVAHVGDDAESQALRFLTLPMMFTRQGFETFGKSDKPNAERPLIDNALNSVVGVKLVSSSPKILHQQRKLAGLGRSLKLEAIVKLYGRNVE